MMELLGAPGSPFVRKARTVVALAGGWDRVTARSAETDLLGTNAETAPQNPLGKVPVLIRPDGPALYDSRVICRYLDDLFGLGLYPAARQWDVLTLEALAHGISEASVLMVYEGRYRPAEHQVPAYVEGQWRKIARALDALEERWISHLSGPLDIGHLALACALGHVDLRHPGRGWRDGHPQLAAWEARISALPAFAETRPAP